MTENNGKLMTNAFFMVVATLLAKALGLLRDILVAANYGTTVEAIAYDAGSRLPVLLFDFVIGGVVTAAFIPIFNELLVKSGREKAFEFADGYITMIALITAAIAVLGILTAPWLVEFLIPDAAPEAKLLAVKLTRIMFPMIIFTGFAFSFVGVLLSLGEFKIPAIISMVSNGVIVVYLFSVNRIFGVIGLSLAMVLGWMMQAFVQVPKLAALGYRYKIRFDFGSEYIKEAASGAVPILLGTWTAPVCSLINTRFASGIEGGRAVTALGYANRFYTIIIGVFSYVATNLLFPYISKADAAGKREEANRLMISSVRILMLVIMPITAGMIVLSKPLVSFIYGHGEFVDSDVVMTSTALGFYAFGMIFNAANEVFTKAFFARKNNKTPMFASIAAMLVNFAIVKLLSDAMGVGGIALASGIAVAVGCLFNYFAFLYYDKKMFSLSDAVDMLKMAAASSGMAVAVYYVSGAVGSDILKLVLGVALGAAVYAFLCALLRVDEVKAAFAYLKGKRGNKVDKGT